MLVFLNCACMVVMCFLYLFFLFPTITISLSLSFYLCRSISLHLSASLCLFVAPSLWVSPSLCLFSVFRPCSAYLSPYRYRSICLLFSVHLSRRVCCSFTRWLLFSVFSLSFSHPLPLAFSLFDCSLQLSLILWPSCLCLSYMYIPPSFTLPLCICLVLTPSRASVPLCLHLSLFHSLWFAIYISLSIALWFAIYVFIFLSISLSLYVFIYLSIYLPILCLLVLFPGCRWRDEWQDRWTDIHQPKKCLWAIKGSTCRVHRVWVFACTTSLTTPKLPLGMWRDQRSYAGHKNHAIIYYEAC